MEHATSHSGISPFLESHLNFFYLTKRICILLTCASMNELKSFRDCADVGDQYVLPKVNHSTLSKKAGHVDYTIMKKYSI